jgi:hypothetical protein
MKFITALFMCFLTTMVQGQGPSLYRVNSTAYNNVSCIGAVSANQTVCQGLSPHDISISDATGHIQWQSSINNSDWSDISNANEATLTAALLGPVRQTTNYRAVIDDGKFTSNTVRIKVLMTGCTDPDACNFNEAAECDDDSCHYFDACGNCGGWGQPGCTNDAACNYNPKAGCDDDSCEFKSCSGCTDERANNFNANATIDDGSCARVCELPVVNYTATSCNAQGFMVWVDVLNLGSSGPYSISNNQNDAVYLFDSIGGWMTGNFKTGSAVEFTCKSIHSETCAAVYEVTRSTRITTDHDLARLEVFPNPADHSFTLLLPSDRQVEITLIDLQGKEVYKAILTGERFEIASQNLTKGCYVLRVKDSISTLTKRVVIQH